MDGHFARLPHIDEHSIEVDADLAATWAAVAATAAKLPAQGFRVATEVPEQELALSGHHFFSRYGLIFRLDSLGPGRTRVRAETRAVFPKLRGRAYRALVIGTRMHVLVTRRLLGAMKRRAERS